MFGRSDWNVLAVTFERADFFRVNGNRGKGRDAVRISDNARKHAHTIYCATFDQKGKLIEGEAGPAAARLAPPTLQKLIQEFPNIAAVKHVLASLTGGDHKSAKSMEWDGYPKTKSKQEEEPAKPTEPPKPASPPSKQSATVSIQSTVEFSREEFDDLAGEFEVGGAPSSSTADQADDADSMRWKLVVIMDEGDEFESNLVLSQSNEGMSGYIIGPDGGHLAINNPEMVDDAIVFNVAFPGDGEAVSLRLRGELDGETIRCVLV